MDKYGRWKNTTEGKGLRVYVSKTKGMQLLFGEKSNVLTVDPFGVCGLVVILFSIQSVRGWFLVVVLMCLGRWV